MKDNLSFFALPEHSAPTPSRYSSSAHAFPRSTVETAFVYFLLLSIVFLLVLNAIALFTFAAFMIPAALFVGVNLWPAASFVIGLGVASSLLPIGIAMRSPIAWWATMSYLCLLAGLLLWLDWPFTSFANVSPAMWTYDGLLLFTLASLGLVRSAFQGHNGDGRY